MRYLIFVLCLAFVPHLQAASWTDNGNGTWSLSVTLTVSTTTKNKMEQVRKWDNYRWKYAGQELDASAWLTAYLTGLSARTGAVVHNTFEVLWNRFVKEFVSKGSSTPDADGLAYTVPASPAAP